MSRDCNLIGSSPDVVKAGDVGTETADLARNSEVVDHREIGLRQGCYAGAGSGSVTNTRISALSLLDDAVNPPPLQLEH